METIEIQTGAKPDAAVIWLHGRAPTARFELSCPSWRSPPALRALHLPHA
jgi:hypothetical protein